MSKTRKVHYIEVEEDDTPPEPTALARFGKVLLKILFRPRRLLLLALIPVIGVIAPIAWRNRPNLDENPIYRFKAADIRITPPAAARPGEPRRTRRRHGRA